MCVAVCILVIHLLSSCSSSFPSSPSSIPPLSSPSPFCLIVEKTLGKKRGSERDEDREKDGMWERKEGLSNRKETERERGQPPVCNVDGQMEG